MNVRFPTLQEMKAYRCSKCLLVPKYQVLYTDDNGVKQTQYLCDGHYHDLLNERAQLQKEQRCEWCGGTDNEWHTTERFGESSGKTYTVCSVCMERQEEEIAEAFEDEPETPEDDDDTTEGLY